VIAFIGLTSWALLIAFFAPAAAAAFAAGVQASRMGVDPLWSVAIAPLVFGLVHQLTMRLAALAYATVHRWFAAA
jgi:hypothetical protein